MYKENNYIVYGKDVCKSEKIEEKKFNNEDYYLLRPVKDPTLKIQIPTTNTKIRKLITIEELNNIINKIPEIETISIDERFLENEYKQLISNGTHEDLIKVIKTTYLRNQKRLENKKKISDKDNDYFNLAEKYLYTEFQIVLGYTFEETKNFIINKVSSLQKNSI